MKNLFFLLIVVYTTQVWSQIEKLIQIKIYTYEIDGVVKASAMPELKKESELYPYKRRFDYLLMNVSAIHQPENAEFRNKVWALYPDTNALKEQYLHLFQADEKLNVYFSQTFMPIKNNGIERKYSFKEKEMMEVASKFFFCDQVLPDTSIQAHICIGLNGIAEANWEKDYTLLEAFCYEAIFNDLDQDESPIWEEFELQKQLAENRFSKKITSTEAYLANVKKAVFKSMRKSQVLLNSLFKYYERNKENLAFTMD